MTPPKVQRHLVCPTCGRAWQIDVGTFEGCPNCGVKGEPFCACGCGASLSHQKRSAVYRSEACSKRLSREPTPDVDPTENRPGTSREWQATAEEAIRDYFRQNPDGEPFHSDALWHLIPDDHRGVISLAVMALVNKGEIVGCGYRKSVIPSRKRAPSQEYRLTEKGVQRISGLAAGVRSASGEPGDPASPEQGSPEGASLAPPASGEPALSLLPEPEPEPPLSALTDPRAA